MYLQLVSYRYHYGLRIQTDSGFRCGLQQRTIESR